VDALLQLSKLLVLRNASIYTESDDTGTNAELISLVLSLTGKLAGWSQSEEDWIAWFDLTSQDQLHGRK
jgi:hypothetical protein